MRPVSALLYLWARSYRMRLVEDDAATDGNWILCSICPGWLAVAGSNLPFSLD